MGAGRRALGLGLWLPRAHWGQQLGSGGLFAADASATKTYARPLRYTRARKQVSRLTRHVRRGRPPRVVPGRPSLTTEQGTLRGPSCQGNSEERPGASVAASQPPGPCGRLHFWATVNSAVWRFSSWCFVFIGGTLGSAIAGSQGSSTFHFLRHLHAVSLVTAPIHRPPQCPRAPFPPRPRRHLFLLVSLTATRTGGR